MLIPTAIQQAPSTTNFAYAALREEQPAGTDAGTFTSGAWRTRVLNTESFDPYGIVSLASNQFTLQAGTYWIEARAPAVAADHHIAKLRNITDSSDTLTGSTGLGNSGGNEITHSIVQGRFTITSAKTFELQHQCQTTKATVGLGSGFNMGVVEVFAEVEIWKEVAVGSGVTTPAGILPQLISPIDPRLFNDSSGSLSANTAQVHRCLIPSNGTIREVAIYVATQSGNVDVGIYNCAATRQLLWSSGSTACPAAGSWQVIGDANTHVSQGEVELAYAVDNVTTALVRFVAIASGVTQLPSAFTLGVAAAPKLVGRISSSFPLPSTIAEGSITAQQPVMSIIARFIPDS